MNNDLNFYSINSNNLNVFFNNQALTFQDDGWILKKNDFPNLAVQFGDWFLTPVRCLFNGSRVQIFYRNNNDVRFITSTMEYSNQFSPYVPEKTVWRVVASIIFLIPGLIIGSAFKGLGYLSSSIRERHQLVVRYYTPIDHTLGSKGNRLDSSQIWHQIMDILRVQRTSLQPFAGNVTIYAEEGTQIKNMEIDTLAPQKLILIGAQLASPSVPPPTKWYDDGRLLNPYWEYEGPTAHEKSDALPIQRRVQSEKAALQDVPPRKSLFSSHRIKRIYIVSES